MPTRHELNNALHNLVRLSVGALAHHRVAVALNRFDPADDLHSRNRAWLIDNEGLDVVTGSMRPLPFSPAYLPA